MQERYGAVIGSNFSPPDCGGRRENCKCLLLGRFAAYIQVIEDPKIGLQSEGPRAKEKAGRNFDTNEYCRDGPCQGQYVIKERASWLRFAPVEPGCSRWRYRQSCLACRSLLNWPTAACLTSYASEAIYEMCHGQGTSFSRAHYCKQMYTRVVFSPFRQVSGDQVRNGEPVAQARLIQTIFGLSCSATGICARALELLSRL